MNSVYDVVCVLVENICSRWRDEDKKEVLNCGYRSEPLQINGTKEVKHSGVFGVERNQSTPSLMNHFVISYTKLLDVVKWQGQDMELGVKKMWRNRFQHNGDMEFNKFCQQYRILKPNLKRHLDGINAKPNDGTNSMGFSTTLPPTIASHFADHIQLLESCFLELTNKFVE
ncbi:hypothetical protein FQA39_LY01258 [Lamprigera yunnana]|nr:hypothetical protein FQA39_LY01258 [Lamprigera yunnana]